MKSTTEASRDARGPAYLSPELQKMLNCALDAYDQELKKRQVNPASWQAVGRRRDKTTAYARGYVAGFIVASRAGRDDPCAR